MSTWSDALAAAIAGTSRANLLWIGDSYFEGQGAGSRANRFVDKTISGLRALHGLPGGLGWSRPRWSSQQSSWPASTGNGTASNSENYQCAHGYQLANNQYREWALTGDSVDLVHPTGAGAGSMIVAVDGTTVDSFSQNVAASYGNVRHYALGSSGSHTVRVTSSGGTTAVDGLQVFDGDYTAGISYWECSRGGFASTNFAPATGASKGWAGGDIHLIIESLYGNDYLVNAATPAVVVTRFLARVDRYRTLPTNPSIATLLYWTPSSMSGANSLGYTHADYREAIAAAATSEGVQIIDLAAYYADPVSAGYIGGDNIHPNAAGHAAIGTALVDAIPGPTITTPWRRRGATGWDPVHIRRRTATGLEPTATTLIGA